VAGCVTAMLLTAAPVGAQDLEDWQNAELRTLVLAVDAARQGAPATEGVVSYDGVDYLPSYLKGADELTYVPFTLLIDPAAVTADNVAAYVAMTAPGADPADLAFENGFFVATGEREDDRVRIASNLQAEGGDYDLYIAIRYSFDDDAPVERSLDPRTRQITQATVVPLITVLRERVTIPDLWNDELQTSSVLLTQDVQPLTQVPTPEELAEFPYMVGPTRVIPKLDGNFGKQDLLGFVFVIYNTGHDDGMPDVTVDYDFHTVTADGDEFFNRTAPQQLGPQTLPPGFDVRQGMQLVTGQNIPLGGFPAGDYRLDIKVTDNEEDDELMHELFFSVAEN
jgi:hypothetical protein